MEAKFIKGTWACDFYSVYSEGSGESGNVICEAPESWGDSMKFWEANAKLIVAAPDLLKALKHTLEIMYKCKCPKKLQEEYANAYMNYSNLIEKATECQKR